MKLKHRIENQLCLIINNTKKNTVKYNTANFFLVLLFPEWKKSKTIYFSCSPYMPWKWQFTKVTWWKDLYLWFIEKYHSIF